MSVRIRLKRVGRKKKPIYRIVVSDSREPRDGKTIEQLGLYDPMKGEISLKVELDRIKYWIENGAKPSHTARNLLKRQGFYRWYHELRFGSQGESEPSTATVKQVEVGGKKVTIEKKSSKQKKRERQQEEKPEEPKTETEAVSEEAKPAEQVPADEVKVEETATESSQEKAVSADEASEEDKQEE